jgi:hypothetical protein
MAALLLSRDLAELIDDVERCDGARRVPEAIEWSGFLGQQSQHFLPAAAQRDREARRLAREERALRKRTAQD